MNTIVAESLDYCATKLEKATGGDAGKLNAAVQTLLTEIITECERDHLQRRRLLGSLARGSREARPAEPEDLGRRPAACSSTKEIKELFAKYDVLSSANSTAGSTSTSSSTARR